MEVGLQEILVLMGVVVAMVIAIDLFKRSRHNRNALKFKLEPIPEGEEDPLAVEIGSVRKIHLDPLQHAKFDDINHAYDDLERPLLQQSRASVHSHKIAPAATSVHTKTQDTKTFNNSATTNNLTQSSQAETQISETLKTHNSEVLKTHSSSVGSPRIASEASKVAAQQRVANKNTSRARTYAQTDSYGQNATSAKQSATPAQDVIILNIMARPHQHFSGNDILKAALICGLRYGDNKMFHFYEPSLTEKETAIFSLVNIVKPGFFDLDNMQDLSTPGLCLFMTIPGPDNIEASFQKMLMIAHKLANHLNTDLYDELHNPLTQKRLKQIQERVLQLQANLYHSAEKSGVAKTSGGASSVKTDIASA